MGPIPESMTIRVRVQPRASSSRVEGYQGDTLRLRVTAPPQDGKANAAAVSLLARSLGIARSRVRILRGHASRDKLVVVESMTPGEVRSRLTERPPWNT